MSEVTQIISAVERGDAGAAERLFPLVYDELRRMAAAKLAQESPGHTLQPTALVHEAYLRLVDEEGASGWENRRHFFGAAAEAMRRILVETGRRKHRLKHGGELHRVPLAEYDGAAPPPNDDLLALDEALTQFEIEDPVKADLVKLRFFAGLTLEEAAAALGLSRATASRYWSYARAWLYARICGEEDFFSEA